jgi:hypothetical protein
VFKETPTNRKKRTSSEERWRNSGGAKGSRNLPAGGEPQIRRRYGRICQPHASTSTYRYHEYSLLRLDPDTGTLVEDRANLLFHVIAPGGSTVSNQRGRQSRPVENVSMGTNILQRRVASSLDAGQLGGHGLQQQQQASVEGWGGGPVSPVRHNDGTTVPGRVCAEETALLPAEVVRMLTDTAFCPGPRPSIFDVRQARWLFKELAVGRKKRCVQDDRWRNSGGAKGSRTLPAGGPPQIRRRYGAICKSRNPQTVGLRYHEYSLLNVDPTLGEPQENRDAILFHVIPPFLPSPNLSWQTGPASISPEQQA